MLYRAPLAIPAVVIGCSLCVAVRTETLAAQTLRSDSGSSSALDSSRGARQRHHGGPELGLAVAAALATNQSDGSPVTRQFVVLAVTAGWTLAASRDVALEYVPALIPVAITTRDANYQYVPPPPCTGPCLTGVGAGTSIVTYHTVYGAGVTPLRVEVHVLRRSLISVVVGGDGGVLWFTRAAPQNDAAKFNFTAAGVAAVQFRTGAHSALRVGYQYHHTSNAHSGAANPGLNSSMLVFSVLREP